MHKLIKISIGFLCTMISLSQLSAQTYTDLSYMFSQSEPGGSARIQGLGGAQTALGGDISSASFNPAGLGMYNRSELSISLGLDFASNSSVFRGNTMDESFTNFNLPNLGVVLNRTKGDPVPGAFRGGSWGISFNRINSFQNDYTYGGDYTGETGEDFIGYAINNTTYDQGDVFFNDELSELAWNTFLTDTFPDGSGGYFIGSLVDAATPEFPTYQQESVRTTGAQYRTSISYGANFSDRFYVGASAGLLNMRFTQDRIYTEEPTETVLDNFILSDLREITGIGFQGSIGLIARPVNMLTIGVNYTTPSWWRLSDVGFLSLQSNFDSFTESARIDFVEYQYSLRTPGKISGGLAYFIGKNGFITADVDYLDYSNATLSNGDDGYEFNDENTENETTLSTALNYRFGAEFRTGVFRIRGGYNFIDDPVSDEFDNLDRSRQFITGGLGIRTNTFFVDLGVRYQLDTESAIGPYPTAPLAVTETNRTQILLSTGFFF